MDMNHFRSKIVSRKIKQIRISTTRCVHKLLNTSQRGNSFLVCGSYEFIETWTSLEFIDFYLLLNQEDNYLTTRQRTNYSRTRMKNKLCLNYIGHIWNLFASTKLLGIAYKGKWEIAILALLLFRCSSCNKHDATEWRENWTTIKIKARLYKRITIQLRLVNRHV